MAVIDLDATIPNNIHHIPLNRPHAARASFERGNLVILSDARVAADFDFLSCVEPPSGDAARRGKYAFWGVKNGKREPRESVWDVFRNEVFENDKLSFQRFQHEVRSVDEQINRIVRTIFNERRFVTEMITWKFQRNKGENLHIDNLRGSERVAQVRLFVNLSSRPRQWSVGRHWRHYAERYFESAALYEVLDDPFAFNNRLNAAAFGLSHDTCDEPRHHLEFAPGDIWLANSALVAHQVRGGDVLALAHHEYPYRRYVDRSESLPAQMRALARKRGVGPSTFFEKLDAIARRFGRHET